RVLFRSPSAPARRCFRAPRCRVSTWRPPSFLLEWVNRNRKTSILCPVQKLIHAHAEDVGDVLENVAVSPAGSPLDGPEHGDGHAEPFRQFLLGVTFQFSKRPDSERQVIVFHKRTSSFPSEVSSALRHASRSLRAAAGRMSRGSPAASPP